MSCLFCDLNLHLSQLCDKCKTVKARVTFAKSNNLCYLCFKKIKKHHLRICESFQRCYICYKDDHHTFLCNSNGSQLFIPAIDEVLLPRFMLLFDPIEQIQFAFYSKAINNRLRWIRVLNKPADEYKKAKFPPYILKVMYRYHTFAANDRSFFDRIKHCTLYVYSKIIVLKNLNLSDQEFLSLLSTKSTELDCHSVVVFPRITFSEIVVKTRKLEKLELIETNIIIENTWPVKLQKNLNGKSFRNLRMAINHIDFNADTLAEFMKKQKAIHIYLDIAASLSYQDVREAVKLNLEKHFIRLEKSSSELRWICIRFIERNEDMPKIIYSLGTYTL